MLYLILDLMQYLMLYLNSNLDSLSKPKLKPNPDSRLDSDARSDSDANTPSQLGLILPGSISDLDRLSL